MVTKNDFVYVKSLFVFGQFSNIKSTTVQTAMLPLSSDLSCFLSPLYRLEFLRIRNAYRKWLHTREIFVRKCVSRRAIPRDRRIPRRHAQFKRD